MQLNKPSLTAEEIAKNCSAMLSYVKSKSDCRINMRNDKLLNDVHSEKMQNLSSEVCFRKLLDLPLAVFDFLSVFVENRSRKSNRYII